MQVVGLNFTVAVEERSGLEDNGWVTTRFGTWSQLPVMNGLDVTSELGLPFEPGGAAFPAAGKVFLLLTVMEGLDRGGSTVKFMCDDLVTRCILVIAPQLGVRTRVVEECGLILRVAAIYVDGALGPHFANTWDKVLFSGDIGSPETTNKVNKQAGNVIQQRGVRCRR